MTRETTQYFLPSDDVNDDQATILSLYFNSGDFVQENDLIYSFETTKAAVDVEASSEGYISYFTTEGSELAIGALVCETSPTKVEQKDAPSEPEIVSTAKPTNKAIALAQKHNLEIAELGLSGIVREKDLVPFIQQKSQMDSAGACIFLDKQDKLVSRLLNDLAFRMLTSEEKIKIYRDHGHKIGEGVTIGSGSVLIGNRITLEDHVTIGEGSFIEAPIIQIGKYSSIGNQTEIVASKVEVGSHNRMLNKVIIDISGGRFPDSNFVSGRGCLIAGESYVNVCREVKLGENVALSPKSMIYTHSFWQSVLDGYSSNFGPVEMMDNTWLGSMAQVLPNCKVGEGAIIVSNSLVSQNVKSFCMVGGIPATVLKTDLKKVTTVQARGKRLSELFLELGQWLPTQHISVTAENDALLHLRTEGRDYTCLLCVDEKHNKRQNSQYDIVLALDSKRVSGLSYSVLLDVSTQSIVGDFGDVERLIINFFRRKGIRFFES